MTVAPFPFDRLPRLSRDDARAQSVIARWLAAAPPRSPPKLASLLGTSELRARVVTASADFDAHAASCVIKVAGVEIEARGSSLAVRALANKILGGPAELGAPRPLNVVEQSIWCLLVATALEDLGIAGVVWPSSGNRTSHGGGAQGAGATTTSRIGSGLASPASQATTARSGLASPASQTTTARSGLASLASGSGSSGGGSAGSMADWTVVELEVQAAQTSCAIQLQVPAGLELRVRADAAVPTWAQTVAIDVPIIVGRCAIATSDLGRLQVRSLVTIDGVGQAGVVDVNGVGATAAWGPPPRRLRGQPPAVGAAELEILGGVVGVRCPQGAVVGEVATGYLPRPMSLPDDAHVELTVGLGTTRMTLRQVFELAVGQVVSLGRPLAGPFEVRAAGKRVGMGELVDVDGELAVRIVSLGDQE